MPKRKSENQLTYIVKKLKYLEKEVKRNNRSRSRHRRRISSSSSDSSSSRSSSSRSSTSRENYGWYLTVWLLFLGLINRINPTLMFKHALDSVSRTDSQRDNKGFMHSK